jgi:two-component system, LytTR family, response regulator LytT
MKVLLIEDEPIWQVNIRMILEELGWELLKITPSLDTIDADIAEANPNLIISDITLDDVSVFSFFNEKPDFGIPVVFMTNYPSDSHYESSKRLKHSALIIKPFHALTLKSTVDLLFEHYTEPQKLSELGLWVRGKQNIKIWIEEEKILWVHSDGNYCFIQTEGAKYSVKDTLTHVESLLSASSIKNTLTNIASSLGPSFIQIHRTYLVNVQHIQKVELTRHQLFVNKQDLPISRKHKEDVIKYLVKKEIQH